MEYIILILSTLVILSVLMSKLGDNTGTPALLIFIAIGMITGSDVLGIIYFDNVKVTQYISVISLVVILFGGGLNTNWKYVKESSKSAAVLATLGVIITTFISGLFIHYIFELDIYYSLLIGSIISSTDAAAVFSILKGKNLKLKGSLKPLLELESGSNDPMAIFLTLTFIELILNPEFTVISFIIFLLSQIGLGVLAGLLFGKILLKFTNSIKFSYEAFYFILLLSSSFFIFSVTSLLNGSGYLAIYISGIILGSNYFIHKKSSIRFFEGFSWLAQIVMFITLGLFVFPSKIPEIFLPGIILAVILILIARPVSVFISLMFSKYSFKDKTFISWVGLRGAVPIILATFPMTNGIIGSEIIFNLIFFVVLTSVLIQGTTIPWFAKKLNLEDTSKDKIKSPLEFENNPDSNAKLIEYIVPFNSRITGKKILDLQLPENVLIVLICRNEIFFIPKGNTIIKEGDILQILMEKHQIQDTVKLLN